MDDLETCSPGGARPVEADRMRSEDDSSEQGWGVDPACRRLRQKGKRRHRTVVGSRHKVKGEDGREKSMLYPRGGFRTQERGGLTDGAKASRHRDEVDSVNTDDGAFERGENGWSSCRQNSVMGKSVRSKTRTSMF